MESKIILLISQLITIDESDPDFLPVIAEIMYMIVYTKLNLLPKPETELMSLVTQTISVFRSVAFDSQPKPLLELRRRITQLAEENWFSVDETSDLEPESELLTQLDSSKDSEQEQELELESHLITKLDNSKDLEQEEELEPESQLITQLDNSKNLEQEPEPESQLITQLDNSKDSEQEPDLRSLVCEILRLEPEPEIVSLIQQIFSLVSSTNSKWEKLISLCPQVNVLLRGDKFYVNDEADRWRTDNKWECLPINWEKISFRGDDDDDTHFCCHNCNGEKHKENEMAPFEIKHPLHPKHPLQLVLLEDSRTTRDSGTTRECYCCDENLKRFFYCCFACDYAMNIACAEKPSVLSIDHPKWHEHTLALFSRTTSLTCDVCALVDPTCSMYICPPCGFVVHRRCINLPRVIRISRHSHCISFTPSFGEGNWSCKICRREIDRDYGGYSCIKNGCSFVAHSKCATWSNIWDGIELEGEPEDIEEEVPPFVRINEGLIQHFMHQHHHLRLDENTGRDYDDNKQCQACIMPIYFGNFYSCIQCDFILHETCANLSRKKYHPVHPHLLTLVGRKDIVTSFLDECTICYSLCTGFLYECGKEGCQFKVDLKCATVSEPLVHESHMHPLFLTTKPGEERSCCVCRACRPSNQTFNCIECDFPLCFECATLPQKVRYKHDKHMLTLSYEKATSSMASWCEACEKNIYPEKGFYLCDEYCCVTLHTKCLIGEDILKIGSLWLYNGRKIGVLPNNEHMSRPICSDCKKRCPQKIVFEMRGLVYCSTICIYRCYFYNRD